MAVELFTAIGSGDAAAVERLIAKDRGLLEARDENGLSPVLAALYRGRGEIAAAILRQGPKLSVFEAAAAGVLGRVRDLVAAEGSLANATSPDGFSPLGLAAFFKRRKIVRYLLDAGADPSVKTNDGKTPGDVAIERGHPAVADLLRSRSHAPSVSEVY